MTTARDRAFWRWWRPVETRPDMEFGEDVARTPTTQAEVEYLATHGALEPGETFPDTLLPNDREGGTNGEDPHRAPSA